MRDECLDVCRSGRARVASRILAERLKQIRAGVDNDPPVRADRRQRLHLMQRHGFVAEIRVEQRDAVHLLVRCNPFHCGGKIGRVNHLWGFLC